MKQVRAVFNFMCWFINKTAFTIVLVFAAFTACVWVPVFIVTRYYESDAKEDVRTGNKWWFDSWNKSKKDET